MKSILKQLTIGIMAGIFLISGCKNPAEDVEIVVNTDIFKSPTLIMFVNAKSNAQDPNEFAVDIIGPNADLVRTTTGGKVFKVAGGMLNLMLDRNANPSEANPVKFTVVVNTPGFAPTFKDISITSATTPSVVKVPMVEYANPPQGIGSSLDTKTIAGGTTTTELQFTTATHANMAQQAAVNVQSGTTFLDAAGQSVGGAQLEARILYQGKAPNGSVASMPGGNTSSNIILANGQAASGRSYFHSLGAVTIDMFAGGKEVKRFSKPLTIDLELGNGAVDPKTRVPLTEGQTVPLWSLNEETGQWKSEGTATVIKNANGNLIGRMQATHLSTWSISYPEGEREAYICKTKITVTRPKSDHSVSLYLYDESLSSYGLIDMNEGEASKTIEIELPRYSQNRIFISSLFFFSNSYTYNELSAATTPGECGSTINFDYKAKTEPTVNVALNINIKCPSKNLQTGLNALVKINRVGADKSDEQLFSLSQGSTSGSLIEGATYQLVASVDGKTYTNEFTVKKEDFQLPSFPGMTGVSTYNAITNTLNVSVMVIKDCN